MTKGECDKIADFERGDGGDHGEDEDDSADAEVKEERTRMVLLLDLGDEVRPEALEDYCDEKH